MKSLLGTLPVLLLGLLFLGCENNTLVGAGETSLATDEVLSKNGPAAKVDVCHSSGGGAYSLITVNANALDGHRAHGDSLPGEAAPGAPMMKFAGDCSIVDAQPDFVPFRIRNNDSSIGPVWDADLVITENTDGDGFAASTPRSGQKVGYGTTFFDGMPINQVNSVDWDKVAGAANVSYLNIWVTDGLGNYAVIASENDYLGTDFATRQEWKIFEFGQSKTNFDWLFDDGSTGGRSSAYLTDDGANATLAALGDNIVIGDPGIYPSTNVGTGAPRGGYGFNLIYGDTQSNFLGAYHLKNLTVTYGGIEYAAKNP